MIAENKENLGKGSFHLPQPLPAKAGQEGGEISQAVLKTVAFLDIFDYPPTAMEIWRFLGVKAELGEVVPLLFKEGLGVVVGESENLIYPESEINPQNHPPTPPWKGGEYGFYFLAGSEKKPHLTSPYKGEGVIQKRRDFFHLALRKYKIAKKAVKILKFIPGVEMVAICNNFSYHPESDIDFFIITRRNRLWLTRAFVTAALHLFRLRRHGKKITDRICLSFYISEEGLNLEGIALKKASDFSFFNSEKNGEFGCVSGEEDCVEGKGFLGCARNDKEEGKGFIGCARNDKEEGKGFIGSARNDKWDDKNIIDDPYLCYWLAFLEPLYGLGVYRKFWQENVWLKKLMPNVFSTITNQTRVVKDCHFSKIWKKINSWWFDYYLGDILEAMVKKIQLKKMSKKSSGSGVIINDTMLKFHENDRRVEYLNQLKITLSAGSQKSEKFHPETDQPLAEKI